MTARNITKEGVKLIKESDMHLKKNKPPIEPPSQFAQQQAAQIWCKKTTKNIAMDIYLAIEFARLIDKYREALIWCSGSADFASDGKAYKGWLKICQPLLK